MQIVINQVEVIIFCTLRKIYANNRAFYIFPSYICLGSLYLQKLLTA